MTIPKTIHYCWFGNSRIPKILRKCIESWETHLPDYKIVKWDESNVEFDSEYVKKAYTEKRWAFVSDYMRLQIIYKYGGIYFDTDIYLLSSMDEFLKNQCFFIAEHGKSIGVGVFGAKPKDAFIKQCLDYYKINFEKFVPIPRVINSVFRENYKIFTGFSKTIELDNLTIYEPDYFYSLPYEKLQDIHKYKAYLTPLSVGVHLWYGSWHSYNEFILLRRKEFKKALRQILQTLKTKKGWTLKYFRKLMGAFKEGIHTKNAFK